MEQTTIGVIGAGQMGGGIAQVFARQGASVKLLDVDDAAVQRGLAAIGASLDRFVKKGSLTAGEKVATLERITPALELEQLRDAAIVIEAATERKDLKFDLFRRLDEISAPDTILASNTSSISITEIAAQTKRPDKVIDMHFFNPVPLLSLIKIVRGLVVHQG